MQERTGRCLCGSVQFSFVPAENEIYACHCSMCVRWGGGPGLSIKAQGAPRVTGADEVSTFVSSQWGRRQFCRTCGTHLFFAAPEMGYIGVSAGALDDLSGLTLGTEIFIDRKPALYDFANATTRLTEAEFLAAIATLPGKASE